MDPVTQMPALVILGFAIQYLRGLRWYNDLLTLLTAVLFGMGASWLYAVDGMTVKELIIKGFELAPTCLGGTLIGHMAAQYTEAVPRYNSYGGNK